MKCVRNGLKYYKKNTTYEQAHEILVLKSSGAGYYRYTDKSIWFEKDTYCDTLLLYRFTWNHSYVSVYVLEMLHTIGQKHIFLSDFLL